MQSLLLVCLQEKGEIATFLAMTIDFARDDSGTDEITISRGHIALRSRHPEGALTEYPRDDRATER